MRNLKPSGLILDLDQTLVDTSIAKPVRELRQWKAVYNLIPRFTVIKGAQALLDPSGKLPIAIVTNSPCEYAQRVLEHFNLRYDLIIGWHDTSLHKPDPAPIVYALEKLGVEAPNIWGLGDHPNDVIAYRAAGIRFVIGVTGASDDPAALMAATPDECVEDLSTIVDWLK